MGSGTGFANCVDRAALGGETAGGSVKSQDVEFMWICGMGGAEE